MERLIRQKEEEKEQEEYMRWKEKKACNIERNRKNEISYFFFGLPLVGLTL